MTRPKRDTKSKLIRHGRRHFTNVRRVGGSTIITLSRAIREASGIEIGDQLLVEWNAIDQYLTLKKDSDTVREESMAGVSNIAKIWGQFYELQSVENYGEPEWCIKVERLFKLILQHLRGDTIGDDS